MEESARAAESKLVKSQGDGLLSDAATFASSQGLDGITTSEKEVESGDSKELEEYLAIRENFYKAAKEQESNGQHGPGDA